MGSAYPDAKAYHRFNSVEWRVVSMEWIYPNGVPSDSPGLDVSSYPWVVRVASAPWFYHGLTERPLQGRRGFFGPEGTAPVAHGGTMGGDRTHCR